MNRIVSLSLILTILISSFFLLFLSKHSQRDYRKICAGISKQDNSKVSDFDDDNIITAYDLIKFRALLLSM